MEDEADVIISLAISITANKIEQVMILLNRYISILFYSLDKVKCYNSGFSWGFIDIYRISLKLILV
jgi:hypothetical protein